MKRHLLIYLSCSTMISSIAVADTTYQTGTSHSAATYSSNYAASSQYSSVPGHQYSSATSQRDRTMRNPGNATGTGTRTSEPNLNDTNSGYPEYNDTDTNEPNFRDQKPGKPEIPQ